MKNIFTVLVLLSISFSLFSQKMDLDYYLSSGKYNPDIPTPESVLGYQVGEWHVSHDQLIMYLRELDRASDRITMKEFGRTYEHRPLILLTITTPENHKNIDQIRANHVQLTNPDQSKKVDLDQAPVVLYQGYSIHGNESSGSNAAMLYAYHLAAVQGKEIEKILSQSIILLDPCYNPDGFNRFANWVNAHKSKNLSGDPANREYNEPFPRGRTNHYWFDLNRDWLPSQHPESQGRIKNFHEWYPNILTDHHEMGTNSTYFFQPGIPSRTNPNTPKENQELTKKIANFHAKALDKIGSLYYAEESFDDFYYGKGSTYPDANGCIGILFEQASSRGHLQESDNGLVSFPFTIRNQLTTSLSTLEAAQNLRKDLLDYQRRFYQSGIEAAKKSKTKGYVFGGNKDVARLQEFINMLERHQIDIQSLSKEVSLSRQRFDQEHTYYVSLEQKQYRLIKAMFEKMTSFNDSLFYDVSAWTLPLAFNIPYAEISASDLSKIATKKNKSLPKKARAVAQSDYAYVFEWDHYYTPKALNFLLQNDLNVKVSNHSFLIDLVNEGTKKMVAGTILIPVKNNQKKSPEEIYNLIQQISQSSDVPIFGVQSGWTPKGNDLGSPSFSALKKQEVLILVGQGITSYDAGEVWHLLDQRYDMTPTIMDIQNLNKYDLDRYSTIVMVNGSYSGIQHPEKIKTWLSNGGNLILIKGAIHWGKGQGISNISLKSYPKKKNKRSPYRPYNKRRSDRGSQVIGGAIFEAQLDQSHPLCYGLNQATMPVFRNSTTFLTKGKNPYGSPISYTNDPLLSGYISIKNLSMLKNSASILVNKYGKGQVINMVDNPNFRAFWYGTNRLFANAIFFGAIINKGTMEGQPGQKKNKKEEAIDDGHGHGHGHGHGNG